VTAWRRLHEWHAVLKQLHGVLLERLQRAGEIDWSRAIVDASCVQAKGAAGSAQVPSTAAARASNTTS